MRRGRQGGGGYSEKLDLSIYPGQQVHAAYGGPGYDCAGSPARAGALDSIGMLRNPGGLPGLSPGLMSGGASQLGSGGIVLGQNGKAIIGGRRRKRKNQNGGTVLGVGVRDGSIPGTPSSGTPAQVVLQESQVGPNVNAPRAQSGGRYGMEMQAADLIMSPSNAVGTLGYAPIGVVPCERGTTDALNPDPSLQRLTTYPNTTGVAGMTQVMRGGRRVSKKSKKGDKKKSLRKRRQQGGVVVGQADSMAYYAPTAGYTNLPLAPQVPNNPGILMQLGYPAGHFNPACLKTN